jgi:ABC-type nickel/cobalt efflux system permease component RcnA
MRKRLLKASAAIFTIGAVALVAKGQDINLDDILELLQKIPAALVGIPAALLGSSKSPAALPLVTTVEEESLVEEESTEEVADDDDHPHSLKPGSSHVPSFEGDLDKTALDKFITIIENGFKSFFRMQI